MKLLVLCKPTSWCDLIKRYIKKNFTDPLIVTGDWGDPLPKKVFEWEGDYIISFLSPWILPQQVLNNTSIAAINFHPGSPKYPGIGGYTHVLYNKEREYGITCHHMAKKVDTGAIIAVKTFNISDKETVQTLKEKTMVFLVLLFYEIIDMIKKNKDLPASNQKWLRTPYLLKEYLELCDLNLKMSEDEISKILDAVIFPEAINYPTIKIKGKKYILVEPEDFNTMKAKIKKFERYIVDSPT